MDDHHRSALLRLPSELLQAILGHIHADTASLSRLARTCHHLHEASARLLYRTVILRNHQGPLFTAALERDPSLSNYVESLTIHYHYIPVPEETTYYPLHAEALSPTLSCLNRLQKLTIKGCQYDADRDDDDDPLFGSLERMLAATDKFQNLFLRSTHPILTNLTTCELNLSDRDPWELSEREAIFLHPPLRHLTILGGRMADFQSFQPHHKDSTSLEDLTFLCCDISPATLAQILCVPRGLRSFTFKGPPRSINPSHISPDRLLYFSAVQQQSNSLLSLDIDFHYSNSDYNPPLDVRSFPLLQSLTTSPAALQGNRNSRLMPLEESPLPLTLRSLVVRDYKKTIFPEIESLYLGTLGQWVQAGVLPGLRMVRFECPCEVEGGYLPEWDGARWGVVEVQRRHVVVEGRFPVDCKCCDYNLG